MAKVFLKSVQIVGSEPRFGVVVSVVRCWLTGMSQTATHQPTPGSPGAVLAMVRDARTAEQSAAVRVLVGGVEWASMHEPVEDSEAAAWWTSGEMVPLAGRGAPLIAEWAVPEFAAAVGVSTDAGKHILGDALELAYRLPETWKGVQALSIPVWVGRRVADHTKSLSVEAAAFVDGQVAAVAGRIGPVQLERLITEARARFMPETLPVDEYDCPDRRHVSVDADRVSFDGTVFTSRPTRCPTGSRPKSTSGT